MGASYDDVKKWRRFNKERLVLGFGSKCGCCGLKDDPIVYDFHHLNPEKKDFQLTTQNRSWEKSVTEAKKCIMVCSHCHRKLHAGLLALPRIIIQFNERLTPYTKKYRQYDSCPMCHGKKPIRQKTCSTTCAGKYRRSRSWDDYDLPSMYAELGSYEAVARAVGGISGNAIRKHLIKRLAYAK